MRRKELKYSISVVALMAIFFILIVVVSAIILSIDGEYTFSKSKEVAIKNNRGQTVHVRVTPTGEVRIHHVLKNTEDLFIYPKKETKIEILSQDAESIFTLEVDKKTEGLSFFKILLKGRHVEFSGFNEKPE